MAIWQKPVVDRTIADVAAGAEKCYFSAGTLNRIEENTQYLADLYGVRITIRTWTATDFLTASGMERILQNVATVRDAGPTVPNAPQIPHLPATRFDQVNDVERILAMSQDAWQRTQSGKQYAGEIYAGQKIGVI